MLLGWPITCRQNPPPSDRTLGPPSPPVPPLPAGAPAHLARTLPGPGGLPGSWSLADAGNPQRSPQSCSYTPLLNRTDPQTLYALRRTLVDLGLAALRPTSLPVWTTT